MIHVKHVPVLNRSLVTLDSRETSLTDTKVPEDNIKEILYIDPPGYPAKRIGGAP